MRRLGKPFALVRSKIDVDIDNAKYDKIDQEMVIPEIKRQIGITLNAIPELKDTNSIFIISSRKPDLGAWSDLMTYLEDNIGGFKAQTLPFSLESITKNFFKRKHKTTSRNHCSRSWYRSHRIARCRCCY